MGLIRLSSAAKPSSSDSLKPGFGLKFLRDGHDSANLVAMYDVQGTPGDWNFFSKDFTTHIGASTNAATKALGFKFSYATDYIQVSALSDWGQRTQEGSYRKTGHFPFKLRFKPHSDVHTLFPKKFNGNGMAYMDQLASVPANVNLYDVYAWDKPQQLGGHEYNIGTIKLNGKL